MLSGALLRVQPVLQRIISSQLKSRLSSVIRSSLCSKSRYGTSIVVGGIVHAFAELLNASRGTGNAWDLVSSPPKHAQTWRAGERARAGGYAVGPAFLLKPLCVHVALVSDRRRRRCHLWRRVRRARAQLRGMRGRCGECGGAADDAEGFYCGRWREGLVSHLDLL